MSNKDELARQQACQERERQIRKEEELRRIREHQINEKKQQDERIKGKPTGERPEKDD